VRCALVLQLSTWNCLPGADEAPALEDTVRAIVADGFGVELWLDWPGSRPAARRDRWPALAALLAPAPRVSLHTGIWRLDPVALAEEIEMCAALRAQLLVVHPSTLGLAPNAPPPAAAHTLVQRARELGVVLALENGLPEVLTPAVSAIDIFSPEGGLGVCIDVGHANCLRGWHALGAAPKEPIIEMLRLFRERLVHVHFSDNSGRTDEHLAPGEALVPWREILAELDAINYEGGATLEIQGDPGRVRAASARRFLAQLRP